MAGARPLKPDEMPWLREMTASLARRAGLPMPQLYLIDSDAPNAFATGRSPDKGGSPSPRGSPRS